MLELERQKCDTLKTRNELLNVQLNELKASIHDGAMTRPPPAELVFFK